MIKRQLVKWEKDGQKMIGRVLEASSLSGEPYLLVEPVPEDGNGNRFRPAEKFTDARRMIPGPKVVEALAEAQVCGLDQQIRPTAPSCWTGCGRCEIERNIPLRPQSCYSPGMTNILQPHQLWLIHYNAANGHSTVGSRPPLPATLRDCPEGPQGTHYAMACAIAAWHGQDTTQVQIPDKVTPERAKELREQAEKSARQLVGVAGAFGEFQKALGHAGPLKPDA